MMLTKTLMQFMHDVNHDFVLVLIFIVRGEDWHLGSVQTIKTVLYQDPKRPITAGSPLANWAPVKAEARNKTEPIYVLLAEDKITNRESSFKSHPLLKVSLKTERLSFQAFCNCSIWPGKGPPTTHIPGSQYPSHPHSGWL